MTTSTSGMTSVSVLGPAAGEDVATRTMSSDDADVNADVDAAVAMVEVDAEAAADEEEDDDDDHGNVDGNTCGKRDCALVDRVYKGMSW